MPSEDSMIAALLRERAAYVRSGNQKRVDQVDAQIKARGGKPPSDSADTAPTKTDPEADVRKQPPQGRTQARKQTTD